MSSTETFGLELLLLPLAILVLAAAGVAMALAEGALAAGEMLAAGELERRLRERVRTHLERELAAAGLEGHVDLQRTPAEPLMRARAIQQVLGEEPALRLVAERWHGEALAEARDLLARAHRLVDAGGGDEAHRLAARGERLLTELTHDAFRRLGAAQQRVLADAVAQSVQALGYATSVARQDGATALWASRGERTLAAVIEEGRLQVDMAGLDGLDCCVESERLQRELRARGVELKRTARVLHGRREGGALIMAALGQVRASRLAPARALLQVARSPVATGSPTREPTDAGSRWQRARVWLWWQQAQGMRVE